MSDQQATCVVKGTRKHSESRGLAWVIGAFVICPCHLPITLALAATLLAGTAAGAALRTHPFVAGTFITLAWLAATWHGFRLLAKQ
jgi:MerE protein